MKIWLISAFEPTPLDGTRPMRFMGIATAALDKGHKITFFTTTFKHGNKVQRFEKNEYHTIKEDSYDLVFIHSKPYKKNISWGRLIAHYDLAQKLLLEIKSREDKPDIIYISLPPISTVNKVIEWANEQGIPVIIDIIDPWPDVFLKIFPDKVQQIAKIPLSPFYSKLKQITTNCSGICSISEQYTNWAKSFTTKKKPSAFFYPAIQFDDVKEAFGKLSTLLKKQGDKLRIIYAGSLASSYDIPIILDAAAIMEKKYPGKTEFIIAGVGPQENIIKQRNISNVQYLGWLGQEEIYKQFYLSDIGLTQHSKGATQSVTYKLFDYLSAGLPILNSLQSEMADIITKNKVGFNNKTGDVKGLVANIERFLSDKPLLADYKENALRLTAEKGDSKIVYHQLIEFVESVKASYQ